MGLISRVSSRTYRQTSHYKQKMVCVPCIFIPLFLWIYNKFLHPIIDPIMRKWMGKPARKIKETGEKSCPVSGKSGDVCEAKSEAKAEETVAAAPEVTNIDEQDDSDVDAPVVTRRTTRSRSRK